MLQIGDTVRFLNSTGGGVVRRIEGNIAYVDEDGFETPTLIKECVVVAQAKPQSKATHIDKPSARPAPAKSGKSEPKATAATDNDDTLAVEETPGGDRLNVVLAFEPDNIRHLSDTGFATYLVNDSNYYLSFCYASRPDEAGEWTLRYAGTVEPGIQLLIEEITPGDLPLMDRISFQCIAYKDGRDYKLKNPVAVEMPLDTTKFFKLHCFRENPYFDKEVIAIDLIRDDTVARRAPIDSSVIEEGIKAKKSVDRPRRRPVVRKDVPGMTGQNGEIVVDLHIDELVDTTAGLSPADMLNLQIDEFRKVMDANLKNKGQRIVFIHGKGEGVLRNALLKELNHRYKGHRVQDASFREYGFGATQVII